MLAAVAPVIAPMPPSVLRDELVGLVADRLGLSENLVNDAMSRPQRPPPPVEPGWGSGWRDGPGDRGGHDRAWRGRRGGGRDRFRAPPGPPPEPVDPRAALARREKSERAFLAFCLALPDDGERRLAQIDVDDYFSAPATRQAAAYLRGRLRAPAADLPAGDEALARLVAELVITAGTLEATAGEARARGAPTRPPPARAPHLQRPHHGRQRRHAPWPPSARRSSTRSATG